MSLFEEIQTVTGSKSADPVVLAKACNKLNDDGWAKLSNKAQDWSNAVMRELEQAADQKREPVLPVLDGTPSKAKANGGDTAAAPVVAKSKPAKADKPAKPVKAAAKPVKPVQPKQTKLKQVKARGINSTAGKPVPARAGTKQAKLIDLLSRPGGATFVELHKAMNAAEFKKLKPWTEATTRSALSWDVHAVKGYGVRTEFFTAQQLRANGRTITGKKPDEQVAVYHLVLPKGMKAPLPHTPRASDKKVTQKAA